MTSTSPPTASASPTTAVDASDLLKERLIELMELDGSAQEVQLADLEKSEPSLAQELRSLMGFAHKTLPGLGAPERLFESLQQASLPDQFGPWRVLGELGRGGMGVVLRGKRADGAFDKEVAIKVLPPLLAAAEASARFVQEARLLAPLDHPHIARLIDAGVAQGCAYFVMDLVEGVPITHAARAMPLAERLKLFLQLCSALAFAHGRLLIHRDIKPANVLVDQRGSVRLLDFGIAKLTSQDEATQTAHHQAFTPAYASPEQIQGESATVASDVFSLGVLLFELCCDAHPFLQTTGETAKQTAATLFAMLERPLNTAPMKSAQLAKDLQAVLQKALDKDAARRYSSVDGLASDIEAYLSGHPVKAMPPSWAYETRRFVLRHVGAVSTAAATSIAILGLSIWSIHSAKVAHDQTELAERRLASVREIANKVVFDYNRALEPINGTLEVRKTLVADALSYLEAQLKDANNDGALKSEIARGFQAVGDVQGRGVTTSNLGQMAAAQVSYDKAFALRESVCQQSPALRVVVDGTTPIPSCSAQAGLMMVQADGLFSSGKAPDAIAKMEAARKLNANVLATLLATDPAQTAVTRLQFNLNHRVAGLSLRQSGDAYARGLALAKENLPLAQTLAKNAADPVGKINLRDANDFLSNRLLASGDASAALVAIEEALAISRAHFAAQPTGSNAVYVMTSLSQRALARLHANQLNEAQADALEALELARKTHEADPQNALLKGRYANMGRRTGELLNQMGTKLAHAAAARLLAEVAQVSGTFTPKDGVFWHQHQLVVLQQAAAAYGLGDFKLSQKLLEMFPAQGIDNPRAALDLAEAYVLRAKVAAALKVPGAAEALELGLKPLRARALSTPADVMSRATLASSCLWAAQEPALAAAKADYVNCAREATQQLAQGNQLTPWWRKQLGA